MRVLVSPGVGDSRGRLYRSPGTAYTAIATFVGTIVCAVEGIQPGKGRWVLVIGAVTLGLMSWREWTGGIRTRPDGVKVIGMLVSKRIPWREIDHFAVLPMGRYPWVGHVVLRDGRQIGSVALSLAGPPSTEKRISRLQGKIDELNQALEQSRRSASARPGKPG